MSISIIGQHNPSHKEFGIEGNVTIWRYMDIEKYLDVITKNRLWFGRIKEYRKNDPYEGAITEHDENILKKIIDANTKEDLRRLLSEAGQVHLIECMDSEPNKSIFYIQAEMLSKLQHLELEPHIASISCWHENSCESDALWSRYALGGGGIAIKSTVDRALKSFEGTERNLSVGKVIYDTDGNLSVLPSGMFFMYRHILVKRKSFEHEKEVRIIARTPDGYESPDWSLDNQKYLIDYNKPVPKGIHIECDVKALIEEVVTSPFMPENTAEAVKNITRQYLPKTPIRTSKILRRNFNPLLSKELAIIWSHYLKTNRILDLDDIIAES